jgi:hypothetical protein
MFRRRKLMVGAVAAGVLQACGGGGSASNSTSGESSGTGGGFPAGPPAWPGHGGNAQHTAQAPVASKALQRILWSMPIDTNVVKLNGSVLLTHYGSPVISGGNTVVVPVKTSDTAAYAAGGNFMVSARRGADGLELWRLTTDYVAPLRTWTVPMNLALDSNNRLYVPGAGGRLWVRANVDQAGVSVESIAFYGNANYDANSGAFNANVIINTPLTVDAAGTVYFGFIANAGAPGGLRSGIARVTSSGVGSWAGVGDLSGDSAINQGATNCAPAISNDGQTLYIAVNTAPVSGQGQVGYLLALNSQSLTLRAKQRLINPQTGADAEVTDLSTASPTVGPDGDVYFGVTARSPNRHNSRGWLLHFSADLSQIKTPGSFGWDDTPSVVPASAVPSYAGNSTYLLLVKYNNYYGSGTGDGLNRMAIVDPAATQADPVVPSVSVMKEVITVLGLTADPGTLGGVREWCVNSAAVDVAGKSALINSEDGRIYRWSFESNTLTQPVKMNDGVGQAYTPSLVGPDGTVYAVNNAQLHAIG